MRIRAEVLADEPLCRHCRKKSPPLTTLATEVDHIRPIEFGGHPTERSNLQPLCNPCHEIKTANDRGYRPRPRIGLDGWPVEED